MPKGHFVITDISGYTEFLTQSELEHANEVLQSLFRAQLAHIKPPFVISGFLGDAIFMYIPETGIIQPQSVLEALENLYCSFSSTREQLQYHNTCLCRACQGISLLDLKMVSHYGNYIIQQLGDREELMDPDVIVTHRMLKNHVVEQTGIKSYWLFSESAMHALQLREFCDSLYDYAESYEHLGQVKMGVYDLSMAWKKVKAKRRKMITVDEAWVKYETDISAPPLFVWDYLTMPILKAEMIGLDFMRRIDNLGGRIREEAKFHCAHGDVQFHYEIVDWNPFNYFTIFQKDSITQLDYYETYFFIPNDEGTHFLSCVAKPVGEVGLETQVLVQGIWDQAYGKIKSFIENEIATGKARVQ